LCFYKFIQAFRAFAFDEPKAPKINPATLVGYENFTTMLPLIQLSKGGI